MAEDLLIIQGTKEEQYQQLIPQIKGLLEGEPDLVANLANICAALKEQFGWLWVGFYLVKPSSAKAFSEKSEELVLGPFQGPVACLRFRPVESMAYVTHPHNWRISVACRKK